MLRGEAQEAGVGVDRLLPLNGPASEGAGPVVEPAGNADASAIDTLLWNAKGTGVCACPRVGAGWFLGPSGVEGESLPGSQAGFLPGGPVLSAGLGHGNGAPPGLSSSPPGAGLRCPGPYTKLKPRWDVHQWGDEDWLGRYVRLFHPYLEGVPVPPIGSLDMRISPWY